MERINEKLATAIKVVLEELPKVSPSCSSVSIGYFVSGGRVIFSPEAQGRGMVFLGCAHDYSYPETTDDAVAQLERHLGVIEGPVISPLEYAEAEFGPMFGKAAA